MNTQQSTTFGKLIAKAWIDKEFKARLREHPKAVMAEMGITVPTGVDVQVLEDTPTKVHLVIPGKPSSKELSDQDLSRLTWAYESNSGPSGGSNI